MSEHNWGSKVQIASTWVRGTDTVGDIADRLDRFTELLREKSRIRLPWLEGTKYGDPWPSERDAQIAAIERRVRTDGYEPVPEEGYSVTVWTELNGLDLSVHIAAGTTSTLGNRPSEWCIANLAPKGPYERRPDSPRHVPVADAEAVLRAQILAWDPTTVTLRGFGGPPGPLRKPNPFHLHREHGWAIETGYRLWLHDRLGPVTETAPGITAAPFEQGTLLAAPDTWPPEQAAPAMLATLHANQLDTIPH